MLYEINEVCAQIGAIHLEGNITPHSWKNYITHENGKVDPVASALLAEIIYWYRPTIIRDEVTNEVKYFKKFKSDLLQKTYKNLEDSTGFTKRQLELAFKNLERLGLAFREFRTVEINDIRCSNVLFIRVNPIRINEITNPKIKKSDSYHILCGHPPTQNVIPPCIERDTNTENTPKITQIRKEKKQKKDVAAAPADSSSAEQLFSFLSEKIKEVDPPIFLSMEPHRKSWIKALSQILEGRDLKICKLVLQFALNEPYWAAKLLSPFSLTKHMPSMVMAYNAQKNKNLNGSTSSLSEQEEQNKKYAIKYFKENDLIGEWRLSYGPKGVILGNNGDHKIYEYARDDFKELIDSWYKYRK
jgi:hypothetical protein